MDELDKVLRDLDTTSGPSFAPFVPSTSAYSKDAGNRNSSGSDKFASLLYHKTSSSVNTTNAGSRSSASMQSVDTFDPTKVVMQGYLTKQGGGHKSWKKRWFVLERGGGEIPRLVYYAKQQTNKLDQEPIKSILLYGCKVTKTQKDRFELDSQGRTFFMCADTEQLCEEWVYALRSLIAETATATSTSKRAEEQLGETLMDGWVWKQGQRFKNWKRRWFVLRGSKLIYYKDESKAEPIDSFDVDSETTVNRADNSAVGPKVGLYGFELSFSVRNFLLFVEFSDQQEKWIAVLKKVIDTSVKKRREGGGLTATTPSGTSISRSRAAHYGSSSDEDDDDDLGDLGFVEHPETNAIQPEVSAPTSPAPAQTASSSIYGSLRMKAKNIGTSISSSSSNVKNLFASSTSRPASSVQSVSSPILVATPSSFAANMATAKQPTPQEPTPPVVKQDSITSLLNDLDSSLEAVGTKAAATKPATQLAAPLTQAAKKDNKHKRMTVAAADLGLQELSLSKSTDDDLIKVLLDGADTTEKTNLFIAASKELCERHKSHPNITEAICKSGSLAAMVKAASEHAQQIVRFFALRVLSTYSVTDENRNAIIQAGGLVTAQSIIKAASSQDGDTRVHKQALKLLTNLAYAEDDNVQIEVAKSTSVVFDLLSADNVELQILALQLLRIISANEENAGTLLAIKPLGKLTEIIAGSNVTLQMHACSVLATLTLEDDPRVQLDEIGGLRPLVRLLSSTQEDVHFEAIRVLSNVSGSEELKVSLAEAGIITPAINILNKATELRLKAMTALVLMNLAMNNDVSEEICKRGGGSSILTELEKSFSISDDKTALLVQQARHKFVGAMSNLFFSATNRYLMSSSADAISNAILESVKRDGLETVLFGVNTIANLAMDDIFRDSLAKSDACDILVQLYYANPINTSLMENCIIALLNLSLSASCRTAMKHCGGLVMVLRVVMGHRQFVLSGNAMLNALKLLTNLAYTDDNRSFYLETNAPGVLAGHLSSESLPEVAAQAQRALDMLGVPSNEASLNTFLQTHTPRHVISLEDAIPSPSGELLTPISATTPTIPDAPFTPSVAEAPTPTKESQATPETPTSSTAPASNQLLWIKVTYNNDTKIVKFGGDATLRRLEAAVREKFPSISSGTAVTCIYKDNAGDSVSLEADDDFEYAIDTFKSQPGNDSSVKMSLTLITKESPAASNAPAAPPLAAPLPDQPQKATAIKKSSVANIPKPTEARSNLLMQIGKGVKLRKIEAKNKLTKQSVFTKGSIGDMLESSVLSRRKFGLAPQYDDDDSQSDDDDDNDNW